MKRLSILSLAAVLAIAPVPGLAHKIILGVFPSGGQVEGELGFSNGDMVAGQVIDVLDPAGNRLGEAVTDGDGFFLFTPSDPVAHRFRADLGAGHVAEATMSADDIRGILGAAKGGAAAATIGWAASPATPEPSAATDPKGGPTAAAITVASLSPEERQAIAQIVRDETRPLRQEIAAYKEKNDLQAILGGLGYIAGLFGLGFYLAARRKLKEAA